MNDKIILDLCGGSGSWSLPYKKAGYDVRLITLPTDDVTTYIPPVGVYGILAAPPCTQFSFARTTAKTPRCFYEGMKTVEACMRIIWECRKAGKLEFWALENPAKSYLPHFLGAAPFTFQPFDFGDSWSKDTALWGWFHAPKKCPIELSPDELRVRKINSSKRFSKLPAELKAHCKTTADFRAVTPPGFAKAFFEANL